MGDVDEVVSDLTDVAEAPTLLVACGFDGALAERTADPAAARAEQPSSEALNVLMALADTTVAIVSRRDPDEVAELMFLSGAKVGARVVPPDAVAALRAELAGAALVVVDADPASLAAAGDGDVAVLVGDGAGGPGATHVVDDVDEVADVLTELARLRR